MKKNNRDKIYFILFSENIEILYLLLHFILVNHS